VSFPLIAFLQAAVEILKRLNIGYGSGMPVIRFPWDAQLVNVRREVCPQARWNKAARAWTMTADDAKTFLQAAQARLHFGRVKCTVDVDGVVWVLGFEQGTPYRLST
jgi:hypothetical protein